MKGQSKLLSLWESIANTIVGYIVTVVFSPLLYWICDLKISLGQNISLALLFTILSIARNYIIRRWFNNLTFKKKNKGKLLYHPPLPILVNQNECEHDYQRSHVVGCDYCTKCGHCVSREQEVKND